MTRTISAFLVPVLAILAASAQIAPPNQLQQIDPRNAVLPSRMAPRRAIHEPFTLPVTADKIRTAIDDAVLYLRGLQGPDGSIGMEDGPTALAALTMLAAGADPAADDGLAKAIDWLAKREPDNTYVRGIRANVWEYALRKIPSDNRFSKLLKTDFEWLLAALGNKEGWRYNLKSTDWDNSCTQYGVLGIWAAARAGLDPGDKFWTAMSKHFRTYQGEDGGWSYQGKQGSTPNMATAGLASLFLVFDMYHGKNAYSQADPRTFTSGDAADVFKAIDRGMEWLGKAKGNKSDSYYLYGIERTGVASGRKLLGGDDWFAEGALTVLQAQRRDGSIPLGSYGGTEVCTSFCTLFLVYGGAPVAYNKLQFGKDQDWNLNPRDLANVSKALWSAYERPINWQIVSIDSPAAEIEAPVLFLSGSKKWVFAEKEMLKLREYIERGGTILAEPSDNSAEFAASMEDLLNNMYPPQLYPNHRLAPLPADHAIYTVIKQDWKKRPSLRGASNGSRTFFLLSEEYMSGDWQTNREASDAFKLAMNLLFYATDMGELEGKFATMLPSTPAAKKREGAVTVARIRHPGTKEHPQDWEAAGASWTKLTPLVTHLTGRSLKEASPVTLGKDSLEGVRLLHLTGRIVLQLTEVERAALKQFVISGGTLLVDAHAGSTDFARTARKELEAIFGQLHPLAADSVLAEGRFEGGVDLTSRIGLNLPARQLLRSRGEKTEGQQLLISVVNRRPAVIFSELDLVASGAGIANYHALAYKPDSARKIIGNLVTYLNLE
jgi:hypothetical protein